MLELFLSRLYALPPSTYSDSVDSFHSTITSNLCIALAILVSWKQFGGRPVECMMPKRMPEPWEALEDFWREAAGVHVPGQVPRLMGAENYAMLITALSYVSRFSSRSHADLNDWMHSVATPTILTMSAMLISWRMAGKPLDCIMPKRLPYSWEQYAENYCWSQDTYFVAPNEHVANLDMLDRNTAERKLSYYQWVPFFLLLEAACFRLPSLIWKYLAGHSGIRIHEIVKLAMDPNNINPECKKNNITALTIHLQNALRFQRRIDRKNVQPHKVMKFLNLPYSAYYVSTVYLVTKLLYLLNVILQLHAMNKFLETDKYNWYGFGVVRDILNGTQWEKSGVFPRVSICDFEVRQVANIQTYSVQCVLVINIFNEKIFILLWFWYMALLVATALSFIYWSIIMILPWFGTWFITRHLDLSEMPFDARGSKPEVKRFVNRYLRKDGVFVMRMITMHAGIIFGTDLVLALWKAFYGVEEQIRKDNPNYNVSNSKSDNASNMLRLRKKSKKNKDLDDDVLVGSLIAAKLARNSSSETSSDEEERNGKRPSTQNESSLTKSLALGEAINAGLETIHSSTTADIDEDERKNESKRKGY